MSKDFDQIKLRPSTKKKIKVEASKRGMSIVDFMRKAFEDDKEEVKKVVRGNDDFFNL